MNYFYVLNDCYVIGFTLYKTPEELSVDIPLAGVLIDTNIKLNNNE